MSEEKKITRKIFLRLFTKFAFSLAGILGLGGLIRYFSFHPAPSPPTRFELGDESNYPPGSKTIRPDIPAVIFNRNGQFQAFSLSCTHLGCTLEESKEDFSCPCHGSRFDQNGQVLNGPADQNLTKMQIEISQEGLLVLYTKGAKQ
jgi:cytochrome b6-f complex iron-sulfur subunit